MALKSIGVFGFALSAQLLACRDDSLVAWAAANTMFDVQLGKKERSNVVKLRAALGRNIHV